LIFLWIWQDRAGARQGQSLPHAAFFAGLLTPP